MARPPVPVGPAGPDRLDALARVFGRAFVNEPMMLWPIGADGDVAERLTECFAAFLERGLRRGLVWEAGDAEGAAVWLPPNAVKAWDEDPWNHPRIDALAFDGGRRYGEFWDWVESRIPAEPLWLLDSIAVEQALQGRGIGKALIEAGLERARADGAGAFLSTATPANVSIYGRCGFRVVEELDAPNAGPHVWFMRSDPS